MRLALVALVAAACGSSSSPPPSQPTPTEPAPSQTVMTEDECKAKGGRVNASIGADALVGGGEQAHCNDDETDHGPVRFGIEGGWCCVKK